MINEDNYLGMVLENLDILKALFDAEVVPSMIFDGDSDDKINEIDELMEYLNKTNP